VLFFDSIGVPSAEETVFGTGHERGGTCSGLSMLRESLTRRSFWWIAAIRFGRARLTHNRRQPELAVENMMGWARYLRNEAIQAGCGILDTGEISFDESTRHILSLLE
jgi:hypothetical protein